MVDLRLNFSIERQPLSGEAQPAPPDAALLAPGTGLPALDPRPSGPAWPRHGFNHRCLILTRDPRSRGTPDLYGAAHGAKSQQQRRRLRSSSSSSGSAQEAHGAQGAQRAQGVEGAQGLQGMPGRASPEMEALAAGAAQPISVDLQPISMDLDGAPSPEPTLYGTRQGAAATAAAATAAAAAAAEEEEEEAPAWGAELISMAEMCNEGTEYACTALSSEEAARLAWLAKQEVAAAGSKVAAMFAPAEAPPPQSGSPQSGSSQKMAPPQAAAASFAAAAAWKNAQAAASTSAAAEAAVAAAAPGAAEAAAWVAAEAAKPLGAPLLGRMAAAASENAEAAQAAVAAAKAELAKIEEEEAAVAAAEAAAAKAAAAYEESKSRYTGLQSKDAFALRGQVYSTSALNTAASPAANSSPAQQSDENRPAP